MALLIKGKFFHGEFSFKNERIRMPLDVEVGGSPPSDLRQAGDAAFERSRARALVEFEKIKEELTDPAKAADRLKRIHRLTTGLDIRSVKPTDLMDVWLKARRKKTSMSAKHAKNVAFTLGQFVNFLEQHHPKVDDCRAVTEAIAAEFMASEEQRGISNKTYNNALIAMRAAFTAAGIAGSFDQNPFSNIPKKEDLSVHRRPYDKPTLKRILEAALTDSLVGPVIVLAICTGMRREDCVRLSWRVVDLQRGVIQMNAGKTGAKLYLPILLPLRRLLEKAPKEGDYCFPAALELFDRNSDGLNDRLKKLLRDAGISESEIEFKGPRLRKPSTVGFHRFKATFVSVALDAGVPVPMLQKLVGNSEVNVIMECYYQPMMDAVTEVVNAKFPSFMTGIARETPRELIEKALAKLNEMTVENLDVQRPILAQVLNDVLASLPSGGDFRGEIRQ